MKINFDINDGLWVVRLPLNTYKHDEYKHNYAKLMLYLCILNICIMYIDTIYLPLLYILVVAKNKDDVWI